ncbi:methyl-accepting chemotaxis protein [Roseateles cavernae]|uniref:methyl-accepting chemotaxis protein n=1 Tax=Roseateles cavernae TaxID=3153578 RepID=UPI0032E3FAC6
MELLRNLRIGRRLGLAFGLVLLLLAVVSWVGVQGSTRVFADLKTIYEDRTIPLKQIGEVDGLMLRNRILVMEMLRDPAALPALDSQLQANIAQVSKTWKAYMDSYLTPQEKQLAEAFTQVRGSYVREGLLAARDALKAGEVARAQALYGERIVPLGQQAKDGIDALIKLQIEVAAASYSQAQATRDSVRAWSLGVSLVAALIAVVAGLMSTRSITGPMQEAVSFAQTVASGDLRAAAAVQGRDEAAQLMTALNQMNGSLVQIVSQVRDSSESIATGSREIASGSIDLSQRTEEQASNLQQTAASMEELSSTVRNNADTAAQANALASAAAAAAGQGGTVVAQVVNTMQGIAEASKRIADIIGTIDGIAFQTNILALNAAVEAARAGEQGRGFAVVAAEVRALAQRSAQAAREIKVLINDSVSQVESGSRLADDAGSAMGGIVDQVRQVSQLIAEIAGASSEQSKGIGQIGDAVNQLDQVTQQNAALVEESTAAAESLQHQAAELARLVGVFQLAR